jgi:transketolase
VIDMPSSDESMWLELLRAKRLLVIAEQNDGYLLDQLLKVVYRHRAETGEPALARVMSVNTLGPHGRPWFIHSATYEELVEAYALAPAPLANAICARLGKE